MARRGGGGILDRWLRKIEKRDADERECVIDRSTDRPMHFYV